MDQWLPITKIVGAFFFFFEIECGGGGGGRDWVRVMGNEYNSIPLYPISEQVY